MNKQEIIDNFYQQLVIENYADQIIKCYTYSLKHFLDHIETLKLESVTDQVIQNYLYQIKF